MNHQDYLRQAIELANDNASQSKGGPFGCLIVRKGEIIAKAANSVVANCDPTAHAEIQAIRIAGQHLKNHDLSGCILYTSCEPCPMCLAAIYWARITEIYYAASHKDAAYGGFDDHFIYKQFALPPSERAIKASQLLAKEGKSTFDLWNELEDKTPY